MAPDFAIAIRRLEALVDDYGSQAVAAKKLGISASYLNDLLHGRREFSERILRKLGLKLDVVDLSS